VRFDLRPRITSSGQGIAYITNSSNESRNRIVIMDLGKKVSWRQLDGSPMVRPEFLSTSVIWGEPVDSITGSGSILSGSDGTDGITLSNDGDTLCWTAVGSRYLYSTSIVRLRDNGPTSELLAQGSVNSHSQLGSSDGLEIDSNGLNYTGSWAQNATNVFDTASGMVNVLVKGPRICYADGWLDLFYE